MLALRLGDILHGTAMIMPASDKLRLLLVSSGVVLSFRGLAQQWSVMNKGLLFPIILGILVGKLKMRRYMDNTIKHDRSPALSKVAPADLNYWLRANDTKPF